MPNMGTKMPNMGVSKDRTMIELLSVGGTKPTSLGNALFTTTQQRVLSKGHEIRNLGEYEGELNIDDRLLEDLLTAGQKVADAVVGLSGG
jgi:hypothetical protein